MFEDENALVTLLEKYKQLLIKVINDEITIDFFFREYGNFYYYYALDGHESDTEEKELLLKYDKDIEVFRVVQEEIFNRICDDELAVLDIYIANQRISAKHAIDELKLRRKELGL